MARQLKCDVCKKPCERFVAKLFLSPIGNVQSRAVHSNYTGHADVGDCCASIVKDINWQKRRKYNPRSNGAGSPKDAVGKGKSTAKV